jgi:hypothetical protein
MAYLLRDRVRTRLVCHAMTLLHITDHRPECRRRICRPLRCYSR